MTLRVHPDIAALSPYVPGKPIEELQRELGLTRVIKLASNENALGPSPKAMAVINEGVATLHRYPDGGAFRLRHPCDPPTSSSTSSCAVPLLTTPRTRMEHGGLWN